LGSPIQPRDDLNIIRETFSKRGEHVIANRSVPRSSVIPELAYSDVLEAADWLCAAFGFRVRLRIGSHRVQLVFGDGAVIAIDGGERRDVPADSSTHAVLVRVDDADAHHDRAAAAGAHILSPPADYPYGERQYTAEDPAGHIWTFSQSIADVDPAFWGGTAVDLS
jgi:uncharacterized glyoxalase superfamily protein PhnB